MNTIWGNGQRQDIFFQGGKKIILCARLIRPRARMVEIISKAYEKDKAFTF